MRVKLYFSLFLYLFSLNSATAILKAYPEGYSYLKNARYSFLSPNDMSFIKNGFFQREHTGENTKNNDYETFIHHVLNEEYSLAQETALKNKEDPLFLLNLSLLYFYLEEKKPARTLLSIFLSAASESVTFRLLSVTAAKKAENYLVFCANELNNSELKYYAYFLAFFQAGKYSKSEKILKLWEDKITSPHTSAEEKIRHRKYYSAARFTRSLKNNSFHETIRWLYHVPDDMNVLDLKPVIAGYRLLKSDKQEKALALWQKEHEAYANKKIQLKDFYTRYLKLLFLQKDWDTAEALLENISFENENEKVKLLAAVKNGRVKQSDKVTIRAKIIKK